ncbi:GntR family transcriptional regulator [Halosquirtibacter laminarini]|uniref:GntR family transcriptional regulator n=1 Tax=Halosquirtibacter laminarini TaxID=3374600 RepID=A0AC61NF88_9BACT|nr:GntR family transcriptional regulator [Prolixibacteraceae bacterium]
MKFDSSKSIYLQICDIIENNILDNVWEAHGRIPSVRQFAVELEVNPNTVANAFSELMDRGMVYNKRGIGYFVAEDAKAKILSKLGEDFFLKELEKLFLQMQRCDISFDEIESRYQVYNHENQLKI